jgi:hypothetical protein
VPRRSTERQAHSSRVDSHPGVFKTGGITPGPQASPPILPLDPGRLDPAPQLRRQRNNTLKVVGGRSAASRTEANTAGERPEARRQFLL